MTEEGDLRAELEEMGRRAKGAAAVLARLSSAQKEEALRVMARRLQEKRGEVLQANSADLEAARRAGLSSALLDRLTLNERRLEAVERGLLEVATLPDPVGEVEAMWLRPNGLRVGRMRVPLGVVGMVYEARPNVTVDAAGLCLKSGNAAILRGGSEARRSNLALVEVLQGALREAGLPAEAVQMVKSTDRAAVGILGRLNEYIDVIIARGGEGLMQALEGATVPLFRHGKGVCHVYVDEAADLAMASEIAFNAKVQRPGVCNAMETLLVHQAVAERFLPDFCQRLRGAGVEVRGCPRVKALVPWVQEAVEEDWGTEYLDLILSIKVVADFAEAVGHIRRYGSGHSEAIVTENYRAACRFVEEVDASAVFVNASTRFNDGGELGLGAEIGISTQKLHARGPMGVRELTTTKFVVFGQGQVRK